MCVPASTSANSLLLQKAESHQKLLLTLINLHQQQTVWESCQNSWLQLSCLSTLLWDLLPNGIGHPISAGKLQLCPLSVKFCPSDDGSDERRQISSESAGRPISQTQNAKHQHFILLPTSVCPSGFHQRPLTPDLSTDCQPRRGDRIWMGVSSSCIHGPVKILPFLVVTQRFLFPHNPKIKPL